MGDKSIGTITGTATFEMVEILKQESGKVRGVGAYMEDSTTYETDKSRVRIGGMKLNYLEHSMALEPTEDKKFIWVEATEDELRITFEKPEDE